MIGLFIIIAILLAVVLPIYITLRIKTKRFLNEYFDSNTLKEAFEKSEELATSTPKSISSMEPVYARHLKDDFPESNIDELRSMAEKCILDVLNAVEEKNTSKLQKYPGKIVSYANKMIEDTKGQPTKIDNIKIHRTAISLYKHDNMTATITFTTAIEYFYKIGEKTGKKKQDRFKTELIYIIDAEKYGKFKDAIGINCPNCGAPILNLGEKSCQYCGTKILTITKNAWIVNNIKQD